MYKFDNLREFNKEYYNYLSNNNNVFENKSLNLIHHIWRVVLQFEIQNRIEEVCKLIIDRQKSNGEWGERDKHRNFGDTVVNIHRLLWTLFVLNKKNKDVKLNNLITNSIKKSVDYIIENHDMHYNINREFGHGMIDRLHYLMQTEYYLVNLSKEFNLLNLTQEQSLMRYWNKDTRWIIERQEQDGGWHEIDRVRSRIGTTADALRGIILNDKFMQNVLKGIEYIKF